MLESDGLTTNLIPVIPSAKPYVNLVRTFLFSLNQNFKYLCSGQSRFADFVTIARTEQAVSRFGCFSIPADKRIFTVVQRHSVMTFPCIDSVSQPTGALLIPSAPVGCLFMTDPCLF